MTSAAISDCLQRARFAVRGSFTDRMAQLDDLSVKIVVETYVFGQVSREKALGFPVGRAVMEKAVMGENSLSVGIDYENRLITRI